MTFKLFFKEKPEPRQPSQPVAHTPPAPSPDINPWILGGFCILLAALFLLISSKSSPLYPINDWVDANAFFTMGKGMMNGKVPYRDLFEQKGPLLYLFYGLGYLISQTTFSGVYLIEMLSFSVFLFFGYRLMALFADQRYVMIGLPLVAAAILNFRGFGHGGSAEQFALPFIAISLYYLIRYFKTIYPKPIPVAWLIINGIVAGCILWIKYSFLGLWVGWMGAVLLNQLLHKKYLAAVKSTAYFLGGMLLATLPWVIYFGLQGALRDWFQTYFIINLTAYPMNLTLKERIMVPIDSLQRHLSFNPVAVSLLLLGVMVFITNKKYLQDIYSRLGLLIGAALLVLGVYGGGRDYIYYFFIFSPLILFGFIILLSLYEEGYDQIKSSVLFFLLLLISVAVTLGYTLRFQRNTDMLSWKREDLVQYRYAAIINQTENPTLLNFDFQDGGFYTAAGIVPNTKFFQAQNIDYALFPMVVDEQNRYIKEGLVDYVVMRYFATDDTENLPFPHLYENYLLIAEETQFFGETNFKYLLFKKIH